MTGLSTKPVDNPVFYLSHLSTTPLPFHLRVKLTKIWPTFLQDNSRYPETFADAVDRLIEFLSGEEKLAIAGMPEEDLIDLHFSLGMMIRNAFGLHNPGNQLLATCGTSHPDDASFAIISELWRALQP